MDLSPIVGDLAMGGFAGYATGLFCKKFLKLVSFVLGGYLASLMYLSSRGFISVQWDAITNSTEGILSAISNLQLSVGLLGIGACTGFALGWKSG